MECVMNSKKIIQLSTTQKIMLSFLCAILVGSFLLALPISSATGEAVPYIDALFTATTSICVTGLVTVPTYSTWSVWGQIVILFLIQLGGLGVITVMYGVMMGLHRRLGLGNRWMLQDVFNLNNISGIVRFLRKVLIGTLVVEGCGALLYLCRNTDSEAYGFRFLMPYLPSATREWILWRKTVCAAMYSSPWSIWSRCC